MPQQPERSTRRRQALEEILRRGPVASQEDLRRKLSARGFRVTQASVSRDLHELGAAKVEGRYLTPAMIGGGRTPKPSPLGEIGSFVVASAPAGPNLLVVKTPPGLATSVALALDESDWPEVLGTVAGDDTFFVATAGKRHQARLAARLAGLRKKAAHA